ncbi:hypothetical protein V2J09_009710 [Rumex salicifolius]
MNIERSFLVVLLLICGVTSMEGNKDEFSYIVGSANGPERWGFIHPQWEVCNLGNIQSPIDLPYIRPEPVPISERVNYFYNPGNAILKNKGHDIELEWKEGVSKIIINEVEYVLKQLHWHTPSEHTIYGNRYAMDLHLVHQTPNNDTAVVAILYEFGEPDPFFAELMDKIWYISDSSNEIEAGVLNPAQLIFGRGTDYYRYIGSFTTPPCTQDVLWTVDTKIGTVSQQQIDLLRHAVDDDAAQNARPLQPKNGRKINLYYDNPY